MLKDHSDSEIAYVVFVAVVVAVVFKEGGGVSV